MLAGRNLGGSKGDALKALGSIICDGRANTYYRVSYPARIKKGGSLMYRLKETIVIMVLLLIASASVQASKGSDDLADDSSSDFSVSSVNIRDILSDISTYLGKDAYVEGIGSMECENGHCLLKIDDGTGSIFVDLLPGIFAPAQNVTDKMVEAFGNVSIAKSNQTRGKFTLKEGTPYIMGRKVELKS